VLRFILIMSHFIAWTPAKGKVLVSTVAQVRNHVITSREIQIHGEIDRILGKDFEKFAEKNLREQIIREWLLYLEASTFYNNEVLASKKNQLLKRLRKSLGASKKVEKSRCHS
jgi:hypothetical protein